MSACSFGFGLNFLHGNGAISKKISEPFLCFTPLTLVLLCVEVAKHIVRSQGNRTRIPSETRHVVLGLDTKSQPVRACAQVLFDRKQQSARTCPNLFV
jgi:hypothetical protein